MNSIHPGILIHRETGKPLCEASVADRAYVRARVKRLALQSEIARRMTPGQKVAAADLKLPLLWCDEAALSMARDQWLTLFRGWNCQQANIMADYISRQDIAGLYQHDFYAEEREICDDCNDAREGQDN